MRTLIEIAALLPTSSAKMLVGQPAHIQEIVLEVLNECIEEWERADILLDPHQFEVIVGTIVTTNLAAAHVVYSLVESKHSDGGMIP